MFDPSILDDLPDYTPEECFVGSLEYAEAQAELGPYDTTMLRLTLQGIVAELDLSTADQYADRIEYLEALHGIV